METIYGHIFCKKCFLFQVEIKKNCDWNCCQRDCFRPCTPDRATTDQLTIPLKINYLNMDEIGELRFSVKLVFLLLPGTHTRSKTLFSFSSSSLQSLVTWQTSRPRAIHKLHHLRGVNRETNYPVAIVLLQANYLSLKKYLICIMSSCIQTRAGRPLFLLRSAKGAFNNYVDKMRGEGVKKCLFLSTRRV